MLVPEPQLWLPLLLIPICVPLLSLRLAITQMMTWFQLLQRNLLCKRACKRFSTYFIIIVLLLPRNLRLRFRGLAILRVFLPRRLNLALESLLQFYFIVCRNCRRRLNSDVVLRRSLVNSQVLLYLIADVRQLIALSHRCALLRLLIQTCHALWVPYQRNISLMCLLMKL